MSLSACPVNFIKEHGDARIPISYVSDKYPLGTWALKQRSNYTKGFLSQEHQQRLENLPGWEWTYR